MDNTSLRDRYKGYKLRIRNALSKQDVDIFDDLSELESGIYTVTLIGNKIEFPNEDGFVRTMKDAMKVSFYCLTDGMVRIDIEFCCD